MDSMQNQPGLTVKETFDLYVRTVQQSDLEGMFTIITDSDDFFFLTVNGKKLNRDEYYQFHREWFKQQDWEMPVQLIQIKEEINFGYALAIFHYRQRTPDGETRHLDSYFTLIFQKEDDSWKVIADICTPIKRYRTKNETC